MKIILQKDKKVMIIHLKVRKDKRVSKVQTIQLRVKKERKVSKALQELTLQFQVVSLLLGLV